MAEHVIREVSGGVMTLTLARADKKNALSNAMYAALSDGLEEAEKDPAVRVVLFQGSGTASPPGTILPISAPRRTDGTPAKARRFASSTISARPPARWSPPCKATRSASAPRCCCIAIWCFSPTPQN